MRLTIAEENYLKAIYRLARKSHEAISTNALASELKAKASSITDMIQKLYEKKLLNYRKYQGFLLTKKGEKIALSIIRRHRLWEVFLAEHLNFNWDEVHDIAEQTEHINSAKLVDRLDKYLGYPKYDPHGDPIPDKNGKIINHKNFMLSDARKGQYLEIMGLANSSKEFLQHLEKITLNIGSKIKIKEYLDFDQSLIITSNKKEINLSKKTTNTIFVKLITQI